MFIRVFCVHTFASLSCSVLSFIFISLSFLSSSPTQARCPVSHIIHLLKRRPSLAAHSFHVTDHVPSMLSPLETYNSVYYFSSFEFAWRSFSVSPAGRGLPIYLYTTPLSLCASRLAFIPLRVDIILLFVSPFYRPVVLTFSHHFRYWYITPVVSCTASRRHPHWPSEST